MYKRNKRERLVVRKKFLVLDAVGVAREVHGVHPYVACGVSSGQVWGWHLDIEVLSNAKKDGGLQL